MGDHGRSKLSGLMDALESSGLRAFSNVPNLGPTGKGARPACGEYSFVNVRSSFVTQSCGVSVSSGSPESLCKPVYSCTASNAGAAQVGVTCYFLTGLSGNPACRCAGIVWYAFEYRVDDFCVQIQT